MSENYTGNTIRDLASSMHNSVDWRKHPCHKGCAYQSMCCVRDVPVTQHDIGIIKDGIQKHGIPSKILEAAKRRVARGTDRCGFLNEQYECNIYKYRPAICMATGTAGQPSETPENHQLMEEFNRTNVDMGMPVQDTVTTMCSGGHDDLALSGARFYLRYVQVFNEIMRYYLLKSVGTVNTLIQKL